MIHAYVRVRHIENLTEQIQERIEKPDMNVQIRRRTIDRDASCQARPRAGTGRKGWRAPINDSIKEYELNRTRY